MAAAELVLVDGNGLAHGAAEDDASLGVRVALAGLLVMHGQLLAEELSPPEVGALRQLCSRHSVIAYLGCDARKLRFEAFASGLEAIYARHVAAMMEAHAGSAAGVSTPGRARRHRDRSL